jgi:hypothetical protein
MKAPFRGIQRRPRVLKSKAVVTAAFGSNVGVREKKVGSASEHSVCGSVAVSISPYLGNLTRNDHFYVRAVTALQNPANRSNFDATGHA